MDVLTLYAGSDTCIELRGMQDHVTGGPVTDAAVVVTVTTPTGAEVAGQVWPVDMLHVDDTAGLYRATLPATLDLTPGKRYRAVISADAGPGRTARWDVEALCRRRSG